MRRSAKTRTLVWLRAVLALVVLSLISISVGAALGAQLPILIPLQAFAVQVAELAAICLVAALALKMRYWALASAAVLLWQGSLLLPFLWSEREEAVAGQPLRVLSLNLWRSNAEPQRAIDYLLGSGADVIGVVEATPEWRQRLTALKAVYPYEVDCTHSPIPCWAALYSKLPILRASADTIDHRPPIIVWAEIGWQGKPITVAAVQVSNPMIGLEHGRQQRLGENLSRYVSALPGDAVLMGDFNSAPWGTLQSAFRERAGFDNLGRLGLTWPSWAPGFARLPIDQIFTRGALAVRWFSVGPPVGSDHLPVRAEIYRTSP
jgi:endonuclease/exonuclease/phosphatase (EEP) superfamily protein YafD